MTKWIDAGKAARKPRKEPPRHIHSTERQTPSHPSQTRDDEIATTGSWGEIHTSSGSRGLMETIPISEVKPELPERESKQLRGTVILIWPYSSSARQFAFLLGDPDFRRRKHGQVRVRFSGSSARAIAATGVGIGDDVVLSLRGTDFVRDGSVNTPGKSIDWELAYTQTLSSRVLRQGQELADLDLVDVAPTPAPRSPVRRLSSESSPAYLKRIKLSDVPLPKPQYNPFTDDVEDGHARKRRRRSYRDWSAWTYLARTPSPEKEDADADGLQSVDDSPLRPPQLPDTPVSPSQLHTVLDDDSPQAADQDVTDMEHDQQALAEDHQDESEDVVSEQFRSATDGTEDDHFRDADYDELYAGPDERAPEGALSSMEEESMSNVEEGEGEGEEDQLHETLNLETITTDGAEDLADGHTETGPSGSIERLSDGDVGDAEADTVDSTEAGGVEVRANDFDVGSADGMSDRRTRERSGTHGDPVIVDFAPGGPPTEIAMPPPPTLSHLQTDFQTTYKPGMLTPIGKEPSSPNLQPLDSSTLPMPSPFPGERDGNVSSYLDFVSSSQQQPDQQVIVEGNKQEQPDDEADYILETSFYSSVSSTRAPAFHLMHESAFTDVRFTFGMDGAAFSRPQTSSGAGKARTATPDFEEPAGSVEDPNVIPDRPCSPEPTEEVPYESSDAAETFETAEIQAASSPPQLQASQQPSRSEVIVLSSSSDAGDSDRDVQTDAEINVGEQQSGDHESKKEDEEHLTLRPSDPFDHESLGDVEQGHAAPLSATQVVRTTIPTVFDALRGNGTPNRSTQRSTAVSEIIDLGSPSDESDEDVPLDTDNMKRVHSQYLERTGRPTMHEPVSQGEQNLENAETFSSGLLSQEILGPLSQQEVSSGLEQTRIGFVNLEPAVGMEVDEEGGTIAETWEPFMAGSISSQQDVKMESIEEAFSSFIDEDGGQGQEGGTLEATSELQIAVPEEGNNIGSLQTISVPDTIPARNTRSKTQTSMSPEKEASAISQPTPSRKKGSLAPLSQLSQRTASPSAAKALSTGSPTRESFSLSPYSLRSQSKLLSPTKHTVAPARRRSARQRSTQTRSSAEPSPQQEFFSQASLRTEDYDLPWTNFGPSQELGTLRASQGKYADVPYVKDSEEDSMHSEGSLSTVQRSDDWNLGLNLSDPVLHNMQVREPPSTPRKTRTAKREPTSLVTPVQIVGPQVRVTNKNASAKSVSPFATQLPLDSPTASFTSNTPRRSRRINKDVSDSPVDTGEPNTHMREAAGHVSDEVFYPHVPVAGEDVAMRSSPPLHYPLKENIPAVEAEAQVIRSPRAKRNRAASSNQHSRLPVTPDDSQSTLIDSQPSFAAAQDQTLPPTPQLTQSTSAALRSFKASSFDTEAPAVAESSPFTKSTPRRNATATDVASPATSPKPSIHSTSDEDAEAPAAETPSVGLSTPIAYYTPLKDLPYFLNRSSTFYSAGSPDVLALVTTPSTPPTRAAKGPKHHSTMLHVTDLSVYPGQTTVQIFRAYADALPVVEPGDVVLLRGMSVRSLNRHPYLVSAEESAWCVWRFGKVVWGRKKRAWGELRAREEVRGPEVERGEGEWAEVERLRKWWVGTVREEVEGKVRQTRSREKEGEGSQGAA
ncbi:hypothetical protein BU23DRAFT_602984 [Bimuria novae-zelandiae CBS 107.79]|uniref:Telomeric single stranded DNA binding POT1/Cdc13 domain-containing protein n=1 Tax=Bimuria novae-zelandiae CBS 107.79 TaxID=1447943 RepID=A0A6A5URM9_9PLEO|nr:hypothetical protein BU23DRAFT_602984 [Bimuria novae-zelandiae CBS 107.79]